MPLKALVVRKQKIIDENVSKVPQTGGTYPSILRNSHLITLSIPILSSRPTKKQTKRPLFLSFFPFSRHSAAVGPDTRHCFGQTGPI
jgi:hypothetical protein